jgi:hypothetical protein
MVHKPVDPATDASKKLTAKLTAFRVVDLLAA